MDKNLNPNQINQIRQILLDYINDRIDSYKAAEKIVDTLYPWETHYIQLIASNIDPWQARARDILYVEELLASCGEISTDDAFVKCAIEALDLA
jgi:hypothetical protein